MTSLLMGDENFRWADWKGPELGSCLKGQREDGGAQDREPLLGL